MGGNNSPVLVEGAKKKSDFVQKAVIHDPIRHDGWNRRDLGPEWVYHQRLSLNFQYLLKKLEKFIETIAISSFSEILQLSYEPVIRTRHNSPSTLSSFDVELLVIYENEHLQHPKKLLSSYHCCSCCVKVEAASACKHWVTDWHSVGCAHGCLAFSLNPHEAMINLISCNFLMNKLASGRCSASTKIALWSRSCFVGPKTPAPDDSDLGFFDSLAVEIAKRPMCDSDKA